MTPLTFSEKGLIVLLTTGVILCLIFLCLGIRSWKNASRFERIAFIAAIVALFLSQITSAVSNYNIMEHLKTRLETMGMSFDDGSNPETDNIEENPIGLESSETGEGADAETGVGSDSSSDTNSIEQFVSDHPDIIFKNDVFIIELKVRNVTADEKNSFREWKDWVDAEIGDEIEYQIEYRNTTSNSSGGVIVKVSPPPGMEYVSGSTKLYNSSHPDGITINSDSIASEQGFNIGGYNVNANAYIRFRTKVVDEKLVYGTNRLVMWSKIINRYKDDEGEEFKREALLDSADVYVEKTEN